MKLLTRIINYFSEEENQILYQHIAELEKLLGV